MLCTTALFNTGIASVNFPEKDRGDGSCFAPSICRGEGAILNGRFWRRRQRP